MDTKFLREALFKGKTSNAFKLGTALTFGWFWVRVDGCCLLYRDNSIEQANFDIIIAAANIDAEQIQPPGYCHHNNDSTHFYIVRRVNSCGYQEYTLSAAVKVAIDNNGNIALPRPNSISSIYAEQINGGKIQLRWYYCRLEQESKPVCFKVYSNNGTGQIDYENPVAVIPYLGRRFYSYQSDTLQPGRYLFAIKAEDIDSTRSNAIQSSAEINVNNPDAAEILSIETI